MPELFKLFTSRNDASLTHTHKWSADSSNGGLLSPEGSSRPRQGHRRQLSLSRLRSRKAFCSITAFVLILLVFAVSPVSVDQFRDPYSEEQSTDRFAGSREIVLEGHDDGGIVPLGQSRNRDGREFFWWEQFPLLLGLYRGRETIVPLEQYVPEQDGEAVNRFEINVNQELELVALPSSSRGDLHQCYLDDEKEILPPTLSTYPGIPQGLSAPLFGSQEELGFDNGICYDRVNRLGPYGYGFSEKEGGIGIESGSGGDEEGIDRVTPTDWRKVKWQPAQKLCHEKNAKQIKSRTAFVIRTWSSFKYSNFDIMMLRAIISELSLASGGQYTVHFLIHVQDDSIPIWASQEVYDQVLKESLPAEFHGMGTLWSVAQMKLIYPPPFPESLVNFSGGDVYDAYRSLHFPFQYFASQHLEYDYFWHWEMDIRVTGHYHQLLDKISRWADKQPRKYAWERSAKFFIPSQHNNSYEDYAASIVKETEASGQTPIVGPQLNEEDLLPIPRQSRPPTGDEITDLITFNPIFDPSRSAWAFSNDITGYKVHADGEGRPPTRAALITASRLSRRLLLLMHKETYSNKHTMFPEMYPASIALQYGLKAVYAPLPVYFDRDWPSTHADEIFNNAPVGDDGRAAGMDHGNGHFHGEGGSVFGPGEHVFRGGSYYSNALFAGYLWRRWLGRENRNHEIAHETGEGKGRMCLPMMLLHPIKHE
ncbi:uncharacterized protein A1O9_06805 [Exophiala aquamarina CBS 119918]|uniref:Uncharacterized protein n=1 Tax=Exophiala aquamarina CBS 119918 TaxID=1182545 RepID=A0A072P9R1_9EURO|nr:uncharacterized protein A1O9_06805 [Exophiala aquamarina CBS 119918]KEF56616.1 hypothetical protein A1O9_06805 [Exophiala aquamarina CBS 119918]